MQLKVQAVQLAVQECHLTGQGGPQGPFPSAPVVAAWAQQLVRHAAERSMDQVMAAPVGQDRQVGQYRRAADDGDPSAGKQSAPLAVHTTTLAVGWNEHGVSRMGDPDPVQDPASDPVLDHTPDPGQDPVVQPDVEPEACWVFPDMPCVRLPGLMPAEAAGPAQQGPASREPTTGLVMEGSPEHGLGGPDPGLGGAGSSPGSESGTGAASHADASGVGHGSGAASAQQHRVVQLQLSLLCRCADCAAAKLTTAAESSTAGTPSPAASAAASGASRDQSSEVQAAPVGIGCLGAQPGNRVRVLVFLSRPEEHPAPTSSAPSFENGGQSSDGGSQLRSGLVVLDEWVHLGQTLLLHQQQSPFIATLQLALPLARLQPGMLTALVLRETLPAGVTSLVDWGGAGTGTTAGEGAEAMAGVPRLATPAVGAGTPATPTTTSQVGALAWDEAGTGTSPTAGSSREAEEALGEARDADTETVPQQQLLGACMLPVLQGGESGAACARELDRLWQDMVQEAMGSGQPPVPAVAESGATCTAVALEPATAAAAATQGMGFVDHAIIACARAWVRHMQPLLLDLAAVEQGFGSSVGGLEHWAVCCQQLLQFFADQQLPALAQRVADAFDRHAAVASARIVSGPPSAEQLPANPPQPAAPAAAEPEECPAATTALVHITPGSPAPSATPTDAAASSSSSQPVPLSPIKVEQEQQAPLPPSPHKERMQEQARTQQGATKRTSLRTLLHAARATLCGLASSDSGHGTAPAGSSTSTTADKPVPHAGSPQPTAAEPRYIATKSGWLVEHFDLQMGLPLRLVMPLSLTLMRVRSARLSMKLTWGLHVSPWCLLACLHAMLQVCACMLCSYKICCIPSGCFVL